MIAIPLRYQSKHPLIQPRGGRSTEQGQKRLWKDLTEAGSDLLPLTIDSKTRLGQLGAASDAYTQAKLTGVETLNGFPLLSVTSQVARELMNHASLPVSLRHGTPFAAELVQKAIEIGISEIEGGPLSYSLPYSRNADLVKVIESWSKAEDFCRNSPETIVRETFGILTACLVPPITAILVNVLECAFIVSNKSGIPMASFGATGSQYQDQASIQAFKEVFLWFTDILGLEAPGSLIAYHHWMGPFPRDKVLAKKIIEDGTVTAIGLGANKVVTKTTDEALGIPTNQANADSVRKCKTIIAREAGNLGKFSNVPSLEEEVSFLVNEAKSQLQILVKDEQDIRYILLKSVQIGIVDPPFAPHISCHRKLKSLRADDGSIRISSDYPGSLSNVFTSREKYLLKGREWGNSTSDEIRNQLQYPFFAAGLHCNA
jgi:methylaspartate mutase epsilon subunit